MNFKIIVASLFAAAVSTTACAAPASSYAGSVTWGAPLAHSASQYPQIIVENDASSAWPVKQAISSWQVPVTYGHCVANINCVRITEVSSLGGNQVGLTSRPVSDAPETVTIQLADNPKMNGLEALQDVAHEFGHALGLGHDDIGVMHASISGAYTAPVSAELARIRSIYLG